VGGKIRREFGGINVIAVDLPSGKASSIRSHSGVSYVETDGVKTPLSLSGTLPTQQLVPALSGRGAVAEVWRQPRSGHRSEREPEQQVHVGPQHSSADTRDHLEQVVVIVPVDRDEHEAQQVDRELRQQGPQIAEAVPAGGWRLSTMIVITTAMTASLNASSRPRLTRYLSR
jgi:hypothetical protein